ncbi:hypothetical protein ACN47E_002427 [Coniothyrium glycines]
MFDFVVQFARFFTSTAAQPPSVSADQDYLIGLRGTLVFQSFLYVFFQTFIPAALPDSKNVHGPLYQVILRKSFSVLFCNGPLIYSWIIILSARTICIPYLGNSEREIGASSIFRRCIRLWIPTFVAYSLAAAAFSTSSTVYISDFLSQTGNISVETPLQARNFLIYFNSLFEIFWVNKEYASQAANKFFPSGTIWIVSVLFQQSYTVYMTMFIVPYTRTSWRVKSFLAFIVAAYWVQSWAWYSVTGLIVADAVLNMDFQARSKLGLRVGSIRIPFWPIYVAALFTGYLLQFFFISWKPWMRDNELDAHTALYADGFLNRNADLSQPLARVDTYLVVLGTLLLVETFKWPQMLLRSKPLVALGRRSFSAFLVQAIVIYNVGIRLYLHIAQSSNTSHALNTFACFAACAAAVALASEIFYRIVDIPTIVCARHFWGWMTK